MPELPSGTVTFLFSDIEGSTSLLRERPRAELGLAPGHYSIGVEARERTLRAAREQLGEAAFAEAWENGEKLSLEKAGEAASRI